MFAKDRDLLALEPTLFRDVAWASQRLISTTGSTSGTTMTLATGDAAAAGVTAGHVALIDGLPVEVVERVDPLTLTVSLLRDSPVSPPIPPIALANRPVAVYTFTPQLAIVHAQLMRSVGLAPTTAAGPIEPGTPDASAVTNADALRLVESLGALHLIFSAAAALGGPLSTLSARAQLYQHRFRTERARTPVRLDLDGDGETDTIRHLHIYRLLRA